MLSNIFSTKLRLYLVNDPLVLLERRIGPNPRGRCVNFNLKSNHNKSEPIPTKFSGITHNGQSFRVSIINNLLCTNACTLIINSNLRKQATYKIWSFYQNHHKDWMFDVNSYMCVQSLNKHVNSKSPLIGACDSLLMIGSIHGDDEALHKLSEQDLTLGVLASKEMKLLCFKSWIQTFKYLSLNHYFSHNLFITIGSKHQGRRQVKDQKEERERGWQVGLGALH